MKTLISKVLKRFGILHYIHIFREKYFPTKYYKNSLIDLKRYINFYAQFVNKDDLCFDIGAHRGHRTGVFLQLGAKVVSIEPQTDLYKYLKIKYKNRAIIENIGLGSEETNKTLHVSNMSSLSTFSEEWLNKAGDRFENVKWHRGKSVKISTLDTLIIKYGIPTFCKIDVEGFEFEVVKGLSQNIPIISIEYMTPENRNIIESSLERLFLLNNNILINYSSGDEMKLCFENWLGYLDAIEILKQNVFSKPTWGDIYIKMN